MPHNRFFSTSDFSDSQLLIQGEEAHHMKDVMRLEPNDTLELINGKGKLAAARVSTITKTEILLTIENVLIYEKKPPSLCSCLPLLRPSHFDWALEKLVELGVDSILVFPAELSERKEIYDSFLKRSHKIIESAMKQSGRLFSPDFTLFKSLKELLHSTKGSVVWADESAKSSLIETLETQKTTLPILLLSGPEKGWSEKEKEELQKKSAPVLLTQTTLRAETAAIFMAAIAVHKTL
jgi:16S rRNA (uracil1498-N3)-methyltransferase